MKTKTITTRTLVNKTKFKHWLSAQPYDRTFDFIDNERCLFASFLNETNPGEVFGCGANTFKHRSANWATHKFPQWASEISRVLGTIGGHVFSVRFVRASKHNCP